MKEPTPRLPVPEAESSKESTYELQHVMDKCLAKEPADRYQGAQELVVDLRTARRRLDSGPLVTPRIPASRSPWLYVTASAAAVLFVAVIVWMIGQRPSSEVAQSVPPSSRPSLAVLYFENATRDPELDWLSDGLTDMLVTDLSQSPNLDVLSMEHLYQILKDMDRLEESIASLDRLQEFARRADTQTVIVGSFMRAAENVRINVRIQDAASGKILGTEKVEGKGEASLFSMVDELTRRIKTRFDMAQDGDADLDLVDVSTASAEAYRHYVQALRLDLEGKPDLTLPLLDKAVEVDPEFASAWNYLATMHFNLGHRKEFEQCTKKAFDLRHRLPARERLLIEGDYYTIREETYARGISAYEEALEHYPDDSWVRNNLAWTYDRLERYDEASEHLEVLIREKVRDPQPYGNYHRCKAMLGQFEKGYDAIRDYLTRSPKNAFGYQALGRHLACWGKLDEALDAWETAESLGANPSHVDLERWSVFVLREQWDEAKATTRRIMASQDPVLRLCGSIILALTHFFHGHTEEGLKGLEQAIHDAGEPDSIKTHIYAAHVLLEKGLSAQALEHAQAARREGKGDLAEWQGLFFSALAHAKRGEWAEAEETAEELRRKTEPLPTDKEKRRYHHLRGEIALLRGDCQGALADLEHAQSMLPSRGCTQNYRSMMAQHVPIWYALASASLATGDEDSALSWFRRITASTTERLEWPIPYVRSFYFLGTIYERRDEMDKAREYYGRFYEYWKDGDMDRERVNEAKGKMNEVK
jgi:tetratricopeptide (TPR) repeat protein